MDVFFSALQSMPAVFTVISVINTMLMVYFCVTVVPTVFRVSLRRNAVLWIIAALLCVTVGIFRWKYNGTQNDELVNWELFNSVLPYVCVLLLVPIKQIWKGLAAAVGYIFVEAVKFVFMTFFMRDALKSNNDSAALIVELGVHLAAAVAITMLLRRRNEKRNIFEPILHIGPVLYVLIALNVLVFVVTMAGISTGFSGTDMKQLIFVFLNIPMFATTVGYAVFSLVKTQTAERTYKLQLEQQIKHYEMMEKMNEDLKIFRHDLPKKLRPMVAYLDNNDVESAAEIARDLSSFSSEDAIRYNTGNYRLDTVLFCEQQTAAADNTRIEFVYGGVFPADGIEPDDIYTIFPNALDNAIEACRQVEGEREIRFQSKVAGDTVFVSIRNPYSSPVKIRRGIPQTDKKDKYSHGYGFRSIRKAAAKYGSDNVKVIAENGVFELQLVLQKHFAESAE